MTQCDDLTLAAGKGAKVVTHVACVDEMLRTDPRVVVRVARCQMMEVLLAGPLAPERRTSLVEDDRAKVSDLSAALGASVQHRESHERFLNHFLGSVLRVDQTRDGSAHLVEVQLVGRLDEPLPV